MLMLRQQIASTCYCSHLTLWSMQMVAAVCEERDVKLGRRRASDPRTSPKWRARSFEVTGLAGFKWTDAMLGDSESMVSESAVTLLAFDKCQGDHRPSIMEFDEDLMPRWYFDEDLVVKIVCARRQDTTIMLNRERTGEVHDESSHHPHAACDIARFSIHCNGCTRP